MRKERVGENRLNQNISCSFHGVEEEIKNPKDMCVLESLHLASRLLQPSLCHFILRPPMAGPVACLHLIV